jgi:hypothetical protein
MIPSAMGHSARWDERTLQNGSWIREDFGDLTLVVLSIMEEWRIAALTGDERKKIEGVEFPPEDLPWQRWDRAEKDEKIRFRPVFPDRPVIVKPRSPLHLAQKAEATFFIGIPAFIEILAHTEGASTSLGSWPTESLSNTWHGTPTLGQLCYSVKTRARRQFVVQDWKPMSIIATLEITNTGAATLPFQRLFLETGHLGIFEHAERLWSNHARIRAGNQADPFNDIVFASRPAAPAAEATELTPPKHGHARKGILTQAFQTFFGHTHA